MRHFTPNFIILLTSSIAILLLLIQIHSLSTPKIGAMASPPPSLTRKVRVYVSAPLFQMSDLFYAVGISGLTNTEPGGVTSDNVQMDDIEALADIYSSTMGIPKGGIAQALAENGLESYIPARDGFNMAILIGNTSAQLKNLLAAGDEKSTYLKSLGLVDEDVKLVGAYLLMAVYSFDMYNITSRCNCMIFNANNIVMDDGSAVELGIGSARGMPIVIHSNQDTSLFAGGIVNPMVAGASGYDLSLDSSKFYSIHDAIDELKKKVHVAQYSSRPQYSKFAGVPETIDFWNSVGEKIWLMRFKTKDSLVLKPNGTINQRASYTNMYLLNSGSNAGQGYIGSVVCGLVKQTMKEFNYADLTVPVG